MEHFYRTHSPAARRHRSRAHLRNIRPQGMQSPDLVLPHAIWMPVVEVDETDMPLTPNSELDVSELPELANLAKVELGPEIGDRILALYADMTGHHDGVSGTARYEV